MSDTTQTEKLTSEAVWKLVEPKINEYWRIAKFVFWIVFGVVALCFSLILAFLSSDHVREGIVRAMIKADKLLDNDEGKGFLQREFRNYFLSDHPSEVFDARNFPLKTKAMGAVNDQFSKNVQSVFATYSFSTSFTLSDDEKSHNLRFYKPDGSTADVECWATYVGWDANVPKRNVLIKMNDEAVGVVPKPKTGHNREKGRFSLTADNAYYFNDISKKDDKHDMVFAVDDETPFSGKVSLDCTIKVSGPVQFTPRP
jgi:hypothetical protein